jgi:uncharacterized Zn finger protein (UPF0148 family)
VLEKFCYCGEKLREWLAGDYICPNCANTVELTKKDEELTPEEFQKMYKHLVTDQTEGIRDDDD